MSSLYKPVSFILRDTKSLSEILKNAHKYYAHINKNKAPETLEEHIELVQKKFSFLVQYHHLDTVIDQLVDAFIKGNFRQEIQNRAGNFIKELFVNTVVFHDYGKVNENFQAHPDKMNNPFFKGKENPDSPLSTHHSALGAYLFIVRHLQDMYDDKIYQPKDHLMLSWCILSLSYTIFRHHSKYLFDDVKTKTGFKKEVIEAASKYILNYGYHINDHFSKKLPLKTEAIFQQAERAKINNGTAIYSLVRLSFSLLTASDFVASGEYMSDIKLEGADDFGILSRQRVREIYYNAYDIHPYNQQTFKAIAAGNKSQLPLTQSNQNLNTLRQAMAMEVVQNIRKNQDKRLFYMEAPTGGGKTNLSMLAVAELLKANQELNKVFYVFPFTTLITQTYTAIKKTLGLQDKEIIELHSRAGFKAGEKDQADKEEKEDGRFGDEKKNYIDNLFVNFPFCLLSHIKFFDLLKTNRKDTNYLLHRLANSVVVIDELQSYNPKHWDKVIFLIRYYARYFNIRFILMSATLPKLGKLKVIADQAKDFEYLLPNARQNYFQNANFSERVSFDFSLLKGKETGLPEIATHLFAQSKAQTQTDFGKAKPRGSVYTIIEFIFKKTATEFYEEVKKLQQQQAFFDEVFVLSGTILSHRRKFIINYLKNPENRKKKILLISTQVVEAGVDIDMDLGYKNQSLVDSDEQLAGRINRNVDKKGCQLFLFRYNEPKVLYGEDRRYKVAQKLGVKEYKQMLVSKDFNLLYDRVMDEIQQLNNNKHIGPEYRLDLYQQEMQQLHFKAAHFNFRLIDQANLSVFVPMPVPVQVAGTNTDEPEAVFSPIELEFLAKANIKPNKEGKIDGAKVFELYAQLVNNRMGDFIKAMVNIRVLKGIMAKFVFSVFDDAKGNTRRQLIEYADIEKYQPHWIDDDTPTDGTVLGFIYLAHYQKVYNEESGLMDAKFGDSDNNIL